MARNVIVRGGQVSDVFTPDPLLTSVNTFTNVAVWKTHLLKTKRVYMTAEGNDLAIRILGSLDGGVSFPHTAHGSATVSDGAGTVVTISDYYTALQVQAVPAVDNTHGTATVACAGASH